MKVAVIGATSWGTTLGIILARRGIDVSLWARSSAEAGRLNADRQNVARIPGYAFPDSLTATASIGSALQGASLVIIAVPSKSMRENARKLAPHLHRDSLVLSASKGLERDTSKRMTEVLADELPSDLHPNIVTLSGPNLSREILDERPASTVIAASDEAIAVRAQDIMMSPLFRVYTNTDVIGVELGGALKNIVALGAGMSDGLGYGDNGKAAFITRGLVEITRLGVAAGAKPLTFAGLAGLGDLIATCASPLSRNYFVGQQLAKGRPLKVVLANMRNVAEGVDTTAAALQMASKLGVEMPITECTYRVLFHGLDPQKAVLELMARAPRPEWSGILP